VTLKTSIRVKRKGSNLKEFERENKIMRRNKVRRQVSLSETTSSMDIR